jgi:hypothetical protein
MSNGDQPPKLLEELLDQWQKADLVWTGLVLLFAIIFFVARALYLAWH